jgi:hypothetical protein
VIHAFPTLRLSALLAFLTVTGCFAQLQRYPLTRTGSAERENPTRAARTQATLLKLPFFDDFSTAAKVPHDSLWLNGGVRVNNQFAVNAPSKGVATFDGLKANGQPWDFNPNTIQLLVDTLTSQPIDLSGLSPASNVVLSFFWQAGGLGEAPDPTDSLLLQVKTPRASGGLYGPSMTPRPLSKISSTYRYPSTPPTCCTPGSSSVSGPTAAPPACTTSGTLITCTWARTGNWTTRRCGTWP